MRFFGPAVDEGMRQLKAEAGAKEPEEDGSEDGGEPEDGSGESENHDGF